MVQKLVVLAMLGLGEAVHYEKPPCASDEITVPIKDYKTNYTGTVCSPAKACTTDADCPTDKPAGQGTPACILHQPGDTGTKFCGVACYLGCGNNAQECLRLDASYNFRRVCVYKDTVANVLV